MSSMANENIFTTQALQFENIFESLQWWKDNHHIMTSKKDGLRDDGGYHSSCNSLRSQFKELCMECNTISSEQFVLFCKNNEMFQTGIENHDLLYIVDMVILGRAGVYWSSGYPLDAGQFKETSDKCGCTYEVTWRGILTCDVDIVNKVETPLKATVATMQGAPLRAPRLHELEEASSPMAAPIFDDLEDPPADLAAPVMKRSDNLLPSLDDELAAFPQLVRTQTVVPVESLGLSYQCTESDCYIGSPMAAEPENHNIPNDNMPLP